MAYLLRLYWATLNTNKMAAYLFVDNKYKNIFMQIRAIFFRQLGYKITS